MPQVLWIDIDVLVRCDAHNLLSRTFAERHSTGAYLAAVAREDPITIGKATSSGLGAILRRIGGLSAAQRSVSRPMFNGGVLAINLLAWRANNVTDAVEALVLALRRSGQSRYAGMAGGLPGDSSQLPLAILFSADKQRLALLPAIWNVDGLGWRTAISQAKLNAACALHWSGDRKGWHRIDGLYTHLWQPTNQPQSTDLLTWWSLSSAQ